MDHLRTMMATIAAASCIVLGMLLLIALSGGVR